MTLEQLVPDLDLCQQLKAAGFPQDTAMVWVPAEEFDEYEVGENREPVLMERTETLDEDDEPMYEFCAAPTAGELEEWLSVNNLRRFITAYYEPYEPIERRWSVASDLAKKPEPNLSTHRAETLVTALAALVLEVAG